MGLGGNTRISAQSDDFIDLSPMLSDHRVPGDHCGLEVAFLDSALRTNKGSLLPRRKHVGQYFGHKCLEINMHARFLATELTRNTLRYCRNMLP